MTSSEKFCLKWNDFQKNLIASFRDIREDFCDVTLAGEGNVKIMAHKVILAASSTFFRDILKENQHHHPLIYIKGIKGTHLTSVVEFIYHGEVNIVQDELNDFLIVAEELQLKGLTGNATTNEDHTNQSTYSKPEQLTRKKIQNNKTDPENDTVSSEITHNEETKYELDNVGTIAVPGERITTTTYTLDGVINSMMNFTDGHWFCTECGKKDKKNTNMVSHIEGNHIDGVSHPCNQCGRLFRSKNSLQKHTSIKHKLSC